MKNAPPPFKLKKFTEIPSKVGEQIKKDIVEGTRLLDEAKRKRNKEVAGDGRYYIHRNMHTIHDINK